MGVLDDLKNALGGSPQEHQQAEQQGLGGVVSNASSNLGQAVDVAGSFGPLGQASANIGALTGTDPMSGQKVSNSQRGLGLSALFGFGGALHIFE